MVLDTSKCHYKLKDSKFRYDRMILKGAEFTSSNDEKLIVVLLDDKLNFEDHIKSL